MIQNQPITYRRTNGVLVPKQRWLFDRLFVESQDYELEIHEPRSTKSHAHFFAVVREAWKNLPEQYGRRFIDAEHLRKFALIKTGWAISRNVVCETVEMAHQVAAVAGQLDESAVIVVQGTVVTIATARSQKITGPGAMKAEEFQKSKQDVIDYIASLIGVDPTTLSSQVSNSSDAQHQANVDRTDTPVTSGGPPPHAEVTGVSNFEEASLLSPDWRDVYVQNLAGLRDKAASLLTRHSDAMQMIGGQPNEQELAWMRRAYRLVHRRNENQLKRGEYDAEMEKLKAGPLPAAKDAA